MALSMSKFASSSLDESMLYKVALLCFFLILYGYLYKIRMLISTMAKILNNQAWVKSLSFRML